MLLLKKHLVALVRTGKKRQTIRLWDRPHVRAGQISYTPGLGKLKITRIEELPHLDSLTQADAIADGFATLPELLQEIHNSYPVIPPGKRLFRVIFEWPWPPTANADTRAISQAIPPPQPASPPMAASQRRPSLTPRSAEPSSPPAPTKASARPATNLMATHSQRDAVKSWVLSQMENNSALPSDAP
jgi:hypothetical protein